MQNFKQKAPLSRFSSKDRESLREYDKNSYKDNVANELVAGK
jgi:hypothetical protein